MIARRLARQPHRVDGVFIIGHIDQRAAAPWQQDAAIVLHHLRQPGNKDFIVRPEQTLRAQNGKTGVRVGLRQQVDHLFAGCLAAGNLPEYRDGGDNQNRARAKRYERNCVRPMLPTIRRGGGWRGR